MALMAPANGRRRRRRGRRRSPGGAVAAALCLEASAALLGRRAAPLAFAAAAAAEPEEASGHDASWLPELELEDLECRRPLASPVVDWTELRGLFQDLARGGLDPKTLQPPAAEDPAAAAWRRSAQTRILSLAAMVLLKFPDAFPECPIGTATVSLWALYLAKMPKDEISDSELPEPLQLVLGDLARRPFVESAARDLKLLLDIAPLHVVAASEWSTFAVLSICERHIAGVTPPGPTGDSVPALPLEALECEGVSVVGIPAAEILALLRRHVAFASGKEMFGIKFLRGLDPLVTRVMRDPTDFSAQFMPVCPPGAAALSTAASMLALMSNPSIMEHFATLAHYVMATFSEEVIAGAKAWGVFHGLAKLAQFALRSFDLVWSTQELLPVPPGGPAAFDALRLDARGRGERLRAAASAPASAPATRRLAAFLAGVAEAQRKEAFVYLTAVGGPPFVDYLQGFVRRGLAVGLPGLIVLCMDPEAQERCEASVEEERGIGKVLCEPAFEGHVVLIKHAFIPAILSAGVDTVWIDFDTFVLRDPTESLREARDRPERVLPARSRLRYGSFLFDGAEEMCHVTKMCDPRQHWPVNISSDFDEEEDNDDGVEMLVTEHWDAKCLNNGLFYVRATHRPLVFFVLFIRQLYINPYTDNQNLFDAFLAHSTVDIAAPKARPLLRYALLDIEHRFGCAEGHGGTTSGADGLATFHFWSSDFRTREAAEGEEALDEPAAAAGAVDAGGAAGGRIRTRDGIERVEKARAGKAELFELFLGGSAASAEIPEAGAAFVERTRVPPPRWKGMCSVTAVGVEELVDERLLQGGNPLLDWDRAVASMEASSAPPSAGEAEAPGGGQDQGPPRCHGIVLQEWSDAMRIVSAIEAQGRLSTEEAGLALARLRGLDVGLLITVEAFADLGPDKMAAELRRALAAAPAAE